ncbi:MAG: hypothetical protein ACIAXF_06245 [Phycisphaerales bacterium JB063]
MTNTMTTTALTRHALQQDDAPLAMLWFTCKRDLAALRVSAESAVDVLPAGSTMHLVFDQKELALPEVQETIATIKGLWPDVHIAASTGNRQRNLNGAGWVAEQFLHFYNAMQLNPGARYLMKVDSDVVLFNSGFRAVLRPERFMLVGQASRWRGSVSAWGAMYFLHRDYINQIASHPDPVGLLEQMNRANGGKYGDYPEDQATSQLAVHLYKKSRVWFRPEADWMTAIVGRWHYTYADAFDRSHYWFYDAVEYGMISQIRGKYKVDREEAMAIRDRTMARHLEASRSPRKYDAVDRGIATSAGKEA